MREKIENRIRIICDDVDLAKLSNIEFYVKQAFFFGCYTPAVVSTNEMVVTIPFEDSRVLRRDKEAKLQFAFTDANGKPGASEVVSLDVKELLKETGYDPV